jgi:hypothetical protein
MERFHLLQPLFVMGPILGLLLIGVLIAVQSGVRSPSGARGIPWVLGNLTAVLLRVFGYIAGLLAVQQWIGFPIGLVW